MFVFRMTKNSDRATDLSGTGAFLAGGRWNSPGTFMLYTAANSSLAYLEMLAHFDGFDQPDNLYISKIKVESDNIYHLPDTAYPKQWQTPGNLEVQALGDSWMVAREHLCIGVRSAINPTEYNYLLNPFFPGFSELVTLEGITSPGVDSRLLS